MTQNKYDEDYQNLQVTPAASNVTTSQSPDGAQDKTTGGQLGGAAVAGGLLGLVVGGPVFALVGGVGAAACATTKGKAGEVARASGDAMAAAGGKVKRMNDKHKFTEKASQAAKGAGQKLKQMDEKHKIVEKTSNGFVQGCNYVTRKLKKSKSTTNYDRSARA
eukprot:CAMPEP_0194028818 /NCGR_PEP_ID=MMETSP0009_2-20130614/2704_1 /TAXON_ID=210454 /ORGANISM="Grammatophora oceanica, Strain CCMP 410" /LENGTH=162 /DNA_ID=CAMNT_0038668319 /DNA_START=98 /DNA_END=586 /DNA_ORIENTATION=+